MSKLKVLVHPVRKEFRKEKCGFDHYPADDFVKSQWQNCTKSIPYLVYRWFLALFFTVVVIYSMIDEDPTDTAKGFWLYFIYMTNWGVMMCMATNLLIAILVTIWHYHPEYSEKLMNMESITSPFRIYWGLHIITLVSSLVITIIYWSVLYNPEESSLDATNILTHAFNSICMVIDLLIVAHPLRLLHVFLPVCYGVVYAIFSYIYQTAGGVNRKGKPYIYHVIDWAQPGNAAVTVVGVLLLTSCIYMFLFMLYKLRVFLYKRMNNATFSLPTVVDGNGKSKNPANMQEANEKTPNGNGVQHSPSGISMVLGNYSVYHNNAFAASAENIKTNGNGSTLMA